MSVRHPQPEAALREFAFDVKLFAVIRVQATSTEQAREHMRKVLDWRATIVLSGSG
jgi:hypothetical protein